MSTGINIAPSSDLTVGTTAVTSGTDTRVFFQAGGVVQQDANFTFDNTLKRLTLKAVGTAGTDIPFRIFNNTETANLFYVAGNKALQVGGSMSSDGFSTYLYSATGVQQIWLAGNVLQMNANYSASIGVSNNIAFSTSGGSIYFDVNGRLGIGAGTSPGARLDVRAQGALSTDIAFRVRNSADTADLISFRGDGSEWIQSVPFRHGAYLTGGTNTAQGLFIGYNVASLSSTSDNCVVIGRGTGSVLQGGGNTIIGHAFSQGTVSNSIGLGRGVFVNGSNQFITGSELYPTNTWLVSTGGEVTTGANLRGLDFKVSGTATGPSNISASPYPVRFYSPNGTGNGAGSNIQFHVAPSNTGGAAFNKNIFSEMFTIRGEADGLNHYQLSTPRVPSASITDGYIQYSNDITAGNAAPHFRTELGDVIKLYKNAAVTTPQGIADALTNLGVLTASTITPSVQSVVSAATVTPVAGNDLVIITAQAEALTLANPTGTWAEGKDLMIRIKDDGVGAQTITWDTNYRAIGVTLPTTTVINKTTYVGIIHNSTDGKWDVIGVTTEA